MSTRVRVNMVHVPPKAEWSPSANIATLQQRARLLQQVRSFFMQRQVLEVETPLLGRHSVAAALLQPVLAYVNNQAHYLQTSPEYAMKRLLAAGSGSIYQLAKTFRDNELGRLHNPEFTLLEWYRVEWSLSDLLEEVGELLQQLFNIFGLPSALSASPALEQADYAELFFQAIHVNPHTAALSELQDRSAELLGKIDPQLSRADLQALLFNHWVEPHLGKTAPIAVRYFPIEQAELASLIISPHHNCPVADRAEIYWRGIELANGYQELTDEQELKQRWQQRAFENPQVTPSWSARQDPRLLAALEQGLPRCAGIALGIDRLLMLLLGKSQIKEVLSFGMDRA